jgi:plastocyanin domain-containing protein
MKWKKWKKMEKMKTKIITFESCKAQLTSLARPFGFQRIQWKIQANESVSIFCFGILSSMWFTLKKQ